MPDSPPFSPQEHPLWSTVQEWCQSVPPPPIPYQAAREFGIKLRALGLQQHALEQVARDYCDASLIARILDGELTETKHKLAYHLVVGTNRGAALGVCSRMAVAIGGPVLESFTASTSFDGFPIALEAFARQFWSDKLDWRPELRWLMESLPTEDDACIQFWHREFEAQAESTAAFIAESATAISRIDAAGRMRSKRGTSPRKSAYLETIRLYWITASLWARSDAGIVAFLDSQCTDGGRATDRVRRDISALGFSTSRRRDHEPRLDGEGY